MEVEGGEEVEVVGPIDPTPNIGELGCVKSLVVLRAGE